MICKLGLFISILCVDYSRLPLWPAVSGITDNLCREPTWSNTKINTRHREHLNCFRLESRSHLASNAQATPRVSSDMSSQWLRLALGLSDPLMDRSISLYGLNWDSERKKEGEQEQQTLRRWLPGEKSRKAYSIQLLVIHHKQLMVMDGQSFLLLSSFSCTQPPFSPALSVYGLTSLLSLFPQLTPYILNLSDTPDFLLTPKLTALHIDRSLMEEKQTQAEPTLLTARRQKGVHRVDLTFHLSPARGNPQNLYI